MTKELKAGRELDVVIAEIMGYYWTGNPRGNYWLHQPDGKTVLHQERSQIHLNFKTPMI